MDMSEVSRRGLVLLGCGKMGSAMLAGWLAAGLEPGAVVVVEPNPSEWLKSSGVKINTDLPKAPAAAVLAVKPQMMGAALPALVALGNGDTLMLSIAAGTPIAAFEAAFGVQTPIIRAMPNTPAAVGRGISAIIGNVRAEARHLALAEGLLSAVGAVVRLEGEHQMDAVTAVSGSGPAYVFHLIEAMADAGVAEGLPKAMAMQLARATVIGAGELARQSDDSAAQLRINVTSPGGTTAAALTQLMDAETGLPPLMARAIKAAADRGRELGK